MVMIKLVFNGEKISSKHVKKLWYEMKPRKPFPVIKAYNVVESDFYRILKEYTEHLRKHNVNAYSLAKKEYGFIGDFHEKYGFIGDFKNVTAVTIYDDKSDIFYIFRNNNSPYSLDYDLKHELKHIYNEDYK